MNKAILMGRLTKDPELKYTTNNNTAVCTFSLAVNRRFAKEGQQSADFINIVTWRSTAEFCSKWFKKGQQVAVIGSIQTRTWDDNEGKKHYATEVVADEAYFADSKKDSDGSGNYQGNSNQNNYGMQGNSGGSFGADQFPGQPGNGANKPSNNSGDDGFYPIDDDQLPF
jgi:single-strand DNA-binding protein